MTKLLYVVISLVVVLVAGVLIAPHFVNWNAYKPQITAGVSNAIGRDMTIAGDIDLAILPAPALTVQGVSLANVEGTEARDMVALDEVRVRIDIGALLGGRIAVQSVRLIRPRIALEVTRDGRASWDIKTAPDATAGTGGTPSAMGGGSPLAVSLDSVTIEDGVVTYRDARSGLTETVEGLTAEIAAESLAGPFRVHGNATARRLPLTFDVSAGRIDTGRPLPVRLELGLTDTAAKVSFAGQLSALAPDATVTGSLKASAADAAVALARAAQVAVPPPLAQPLAVEGEVAASATSVGVNKLAIRLGDMSLSGAVHALLDGPTPKIDVLLTASRIDLDALLAAVGGGAPDRAAAEPAGLRPIPVAARAPAAQAGGAAPFTLPAGIAVTFDVTAEAAAYKGGVIRDIALKGELADGALTVSRVAALLPGSADFALSGVLRPAKGQPQFSGDLAATADNLRGMIEWLGVAPSALPADRLRSFSYTSKVQATPKSAQVTDIAMQVDTSRITGGLVADLQREKPGIGLQLTVDKLNLDAYLPREAPAQKGTLTKPAPANPAPAAPPTGKDSKPGAARPVPTLAGFPLPPAIGDLLDAVDANIDLRAGQISYQGETIRTARLDLTLFDSKVTVREASVADLAGIGASASAVLSGVRQAPRLGLDYVVEVRDAARLFRFLETTPPIPVARLGKLGGSGKLELTRDGLTTKSTLQAAGAGIGLDGAVRGLPGSPTVDLQVAASHPELATLAQTFAPGYRPAASKLGPLALNFRLSGTPAALRVEQIRGKAGPVSVEGHVAATIATAPMKIEADLRTSEVLVDLFEPVAAPGGRTAGGSARPGTGRTGGAGSGPVHAAGGRWSSEPIALPLAPGVDVDAKLEMAALTKGDLQLVAPKLHARLQGGKLSLDSFTARLFEGTITANATVEPQGKTAVVAADLKVDKVNSRTAVKALSGHDRVEGPLSLTAQLRTRGISEAELVSALDGTASLAGQLRVLLTRDERNMVGAAQGGALLSGLLGDKFKINELQRLAPVTQLMVSLDQAFGRNPAQLSGDVNISKGVARTDNLKLAGTGGTALTRATVDLPRWDLASRTDLIDDPKLEPAVTLEASGPLDAPSRTRVGGRILKGGTSDARSKATDTLQKALPGVFGGQQPTQGQQPPQKVTPKDIIQGIEGIFGKRQR